MHSPHCSECTNFISIIEPTTSWLVSRAKNARMRGLNLSVVRVFQLLTQLAAKICSGRSPMGLDRRYRP